MLHITGRRDDGRGDKQIQTQTYIYKDCIHTLTVTQRTSLLCFYCSLYRVRQNFGCAANGSDLFCCTFHSFIVNRWLRCHSFTQHCLLSWETHAPQHETRRAHTASPARCSKGRSCSRWERWNGTRRKTIIVLLILLVRKRLSFCWSNVHVRYSCHNLCE